MSQNLRRPDRSRCADTASACGHRRFPRQRLPPSESGAQICQPRATELEWQSQNRTSQESKDGQDIQKHAARGIAVHLFVRDQKKRSGGGSAPFIYCGTVDFQKWEGDKPITVRWRLREAVPERLREVLGVPREGTGS